MPYIDPSWAQIQEGLYLEVRQVNVGTTVYNFRYLHSADGYCFYDKTLAEEDRIYMQEAGLALQLDTVEKINAKFQSVPVEEWMEIVSVPNNPEVTI